MQMLQTLQKGERQKGERRKHVSSEACLRRDVVEASVE